MNVYECTACGELDVERPTRVEVIHPDSDLPQWSAWLCSDCYAKIGNRGFEPGSWSANGYTYTGSDGTRIDIRPLSTKRFPRQTVDQSEEG